MKRILLLIGALGMFAAGTASAQSRLTISIGFGVPRPYLEGTVFPGRPHVRPMYRPFLYHRFDRHRHDRRCERARRLERRFRRRFDRD